MPLFNRSTLLFWIAILHGLFLPIFSNEYQIVFIHIGKQLPSHIEEAIDQAALFNPKAHIYLLGNVNAISHVAKKYAYTNIEIIPLESIPKSKEHCRFLRSPRSISTPKQSESLDQLEHLFYLDDFTQKFNLETIFYLEDDTMLYVDLSELLHLFKTFYPSIGATFDNEERCVPGFMYFKNQSSINHLTQFIQRQTANKLNHMELLAKYKEQFGTEKIDSLPILTNEYAKDSPMISIDGHKANEKHDYQKNIYFFNSIFDAVAIGQYLNGIYTNDTLNSLQFINKSCVFNPRHFSYLWKMDHKQRLVPFLSYHGKEYRINNLHITSKQLSYFSSKKNKG